MRIQRQAETFTRVAYNYEVFQMPTEAAWHYRKFDVYAEMEGPSDAERQEELERDIAAYGIQKPLSIALGSDHRQALMQDGNHRIAAARKLGLYEVPVSVDTWDEVDLAYLGTQGAKDLEPWLRQWVSANL